jgi:hypothetical protein
VLMGGCFSYSFCSMAESSWPTPVTTQEHLQNLMSPRCMTTVELATCHVHADPASPVPAGGYVVA